MAKLSSRLQSSARLYTCGTSSRVTTKWSLLLCCSARAPSCGRHIVKENVQDGALAEGDKMWASFRFFEGPRHTTKEVSTRAATFDYATTAKFAIDSDLIKHLQTGAMTVKLHRARGDDETVFGVARIVLSEVLRAFCSGQGAAPSLRTAWVIAPERCARA